MPNKIMLLLLPTDLALIRDALAIIDPGDEDAQDRRIFLEQSFDLLVRTHDSYTVTAVKEGA